MGHLPEREVCYMRRHIDFDKIGITRSEEHTSELQSH